MVKPTSVNTDLIPMASGAKGPTSRNVMPGPSAMGGASGGMSAAGGGTGANPARNGGIPVSSGSYGQRTGSPSPSAPLTPGNVPSKALGGASDAKMAMLSHGRVLAGIAAIRSVHGDHPHLQAAHAKSSAHIKKYKGGGKTMGMSSGPKFGALGGGGMSANPSGMGGAMNMPMPDDM